METGQGQKHKNDDETVISINKNSILSMKTGTR